MNKIGFFVVNRPSDFFTCSIISLTSFTPALMALSLKKGRLDSSAIISASVVLPTPGGPQKISDGITPDLIFL